MKKIEVKQDLISKISKDINNNEMKKYEQETLVEYKRKLLRTTDKNKRAELLRKIELLEGKND